MDEGERLFIGSLTNVKLKWHMSLIPRTVVLDRGPKGNKGSIETKPLINCNRVKVEVPTGTRERKVSNGGRR